MPSDDSEVEAQAEVRPPGPRQTLGAASTGREVGVPDIQFVFDACTAALVLIDRHLTVRLVNQVCADLTGTSLEEVIGRSAWELLPRGIERAQGQARDRVSVTARSRTTAEQVYVDARGNRRRVAWSIRPLFWPSPSVPDVGELLLATGVDVTQDRLMLATWRHLAHTDPLTELPNRAAALSALAVHLDPLRGAGCAVLFCDLDGFKRVNDIHGHPLGDQVLIEVAQRLRSGVRDSDLVARFGGDEFLLIMPAEGVHGAHAVAARMEASLAEVFHIGGLSIRIGISIGMRVADPGEQVSDILHDADAALYVQKSARRSR